MEEEEQAKVTKMNKNLEDVLMGKKRTGTSNG